MADYYSVIADAICRLRSKGDDKRRWIYERARTALQDRVRTLEPPLSEAALAYEQLALDAAICRVEANLSHDNTP